MGTAIGTTLPLAVGVAISPLPIIAVILLLVTPRASTCGPAFLVGWLVGLLAMGTVELPPAQPAGASSASTPATWAAVVQLAIGVLLLVLAAGASCNRVLLNQATYSTIASPSRERVRQTRS